MKEKKAPAPIPYEKISKTLWDARYKRGFVYQFRDKELGEEFEDAMNPRCFWNQAWTLGSFISIHKDEYLTRWRLFPGRTKDDDVRDLPWEECE